MANDDEYIMSCFKEFVSTRTSSVTYYEMDEYQVSKFNKDIMTVRRNSKPKVFPDFVGELMAVEVFNVTSSEETTENGAVFSKETSNLKKSMAKALRPSENTKEKNDGRSYIGTLEYKNHSYDFWISSLLRNIMNHKESRLNYSPNGEKMVFLAHYTQKVLCNKDENGIKQWHRLGVDREALQLIYCQLKGFIDYFILFNETESEAEVIPIERIPSHLENYTLYNNFYPRKGAGHIYVGISETI